MTLDAPAPDAAKCWSWSRRLRCAIGALGLLVSSASSAALAFNYTGGALTYTPPPSGLTQPSPFGSFVFGTVTFDEAIVAPDFTGTVSSGFTGSLATSSLAPRPIGANAGQPPSFTFENGELVGWNLRTDFSLLPGIANYLVPLFTANGADSFLPITGGQVLGRAGAVGGTWTLQAEPSPVPLPRSGMLLVAGVLCLVMWLRAARPGASPTG